MLDKTAAHAVPITANPVIKDRAEVFNSPEVSERFGQLVKQVKRVAPRSDEFLYFSCRAITAAEGSNYDDAGKYIGDGHFDAVGGKRQWISSSNEHGKDPYMNANGDVFGEDELLKTNAQGIPAYKTFIGRGFFTNHQSKDVEKLRGIILDAVWVPEGKYVELLVACDKKGYPELARQIEAGYMTDVSMGTQVAHSICSICGNVAITEDDYCDCVKFSKGRIVSGKLCYEDNIGLNFIELSAVSTGADKKAKVRQVIASLSGVVESREKQLETGKLTSEEFNIIRAEMNRMNDILERLAGAKDEEALCKVASDSNIEIRKTRREALMHKLTSAGVKTALDDEGGEKKDIEDEISNVRHRLDNLQKTIDIAESNVNKNAKTGGVAMNKARLEFRKQRREAYFQGTEEPKKYPVDPLQDKQRKADSDKQWKENAQTSKKMGPAGEELRLKEKLSRAELEDRKMKRRAYFQGTEEPKKYPVDPLQDKQRKADSDKQWKENAQTSKVMGPAGEEARLKEKLQRAKLKAVLTKNAEDAKKSSWTIYADDEALVTATAEEIFGDVLDKPVCNEDGSIDKTFKNNQEYVTSKEYGKDLITSIRTAGYDKTVAMIKNAQVSMDEEGKDTTLPPAEEMPAEEIPAEEEEGRGVIATLGEVEDKIAEIGDLIGDLRDQLGAEGIEELEAERNELDEAADELAEIGEAMKGASTDKKEQVVKIAKEAVASAKDSIKLVDETIKTAKEKLQKTAQEAPAEEKPAEAPAEEKPAEAPAEEKPAEAPAEEKTAQEAPAEEKPAEAPAEEKPAEEKPAEEEKEASAKMQERKAAREAIAAEMFKVSPHLKEAHPRGGTDLKMPGGPKPADAYVETIEEAQKMDLAVATKPKATGKQGRSMARKEVVAALEKEAAADQGAKKYYHELWDKTEGGREFAEGLTKDYAQTRRTASNEEYRVKIRRAYDTAVEAQKKGMVEDTDEARNAFVNEIMNFDDAAFESYKRIIDNTKVANTAAGVVKTASVNKALAVGMNTGEDKSFQEELDGLDWH
jgi:hypothetical protein